MKEPLAQEKVKVISKRRGTIISPFKFTIRAETMHSLHFKRFTVKKISNYPRIESM